MIEARTNPSYYALRVRPEAVAPTWWAAAHAAGHDAPRPVRAVLAGRTRVEITAEEAVLAMHWASHLSGWPGNGGPKPLFVHPGLPD
jgi:ABC-type uncharacterized transport system YnjBCD substrate-binding protein